jgi:hypothetical protein
MATWVGITPPVTNRNGGRGSSSKLVELTVPVIELDFRIDHAQGVRILIADEDTIVRGSLSPLRQRFWHYR